MRDTTPLPAIRPLAAGRSIILTYRLGDFGMIETNPHPGIAYEPRPLILAETNPAIADCRGMRIGILVVTYNAVSTLIPVLKRIPPVVWDNVEEVVVFDDASQDG